VDLRTLHRSRVAIAAVLASMSGATLVSCNRDTTRASPTVSPREPPVSPPSEEQRPPRSNPGRGDGMMHPHQADCPAAVEGADVAVSDTDAGVALTFTTGAADVAALRTRGWSMAQMGADV